MEGKVEAGVWQVWGEDNDISIVCKPRFLLVESLSSILVGYMFPWRIKTSKRNTWELISIIVSDLLLGGKKSATPNS